MARPLKRANGEIGGGAARVAARRRDTPVRGVAKPAKRVASSSKRGKDTGGGSVKKLAKLVVLIAAMLCIGFFAVLVVDVAAKLVGHVRLGEVTVVELWHKIADRVLDRDVPKPVTPEPTRSSTKLHAGTSSSTPSAAPTTRAPLPAAKPEDDARHVDARPDPEVQQAKERLDELLKRMPGGR